MKQDQDQIDRFKAMAKELEADKDEGRWEGQLRKLMTAKPASKNITDHDQG